MSVKVRKGYLMGCEPSWLHFHISHWTTLPTVVGEGNGNRLQYPCLENSMDRGAWWATVHGVTKSWTWLSDLHSERLSLTHSLTHSHPVRWFFWRSSLQQTYRHHNIIYLIFILIYLFGCTGIFIAVCGIFSCSMWDLVPCPRIKPRHPTLGAWSLSHWTIREDSTFWIKQLSSSLVGEAGNIKKSEPQK